MYICANCGTESKGTSKTKGSIFIELILWLCFLVPGLIYSIWRLTTRHRVCPYCQAPNLIPTHTPRAKQLRAQFGSGGG